MSKVFISYSRSNAQRVNELHSDIENLGHDVWVDRDLTGGQRWWDLILERIRNCDVYIIAVSSPAIESRACLSELEYATALGKPILPVLVDRNVSDSLMPPALAALQRVDYTAADKAAFASLNRGLAQLPAAPPLPASLPKTPDVPASYLFDLRTEIEAASLTSEQQEKLFQQLKTRLEQGHDPEDLRALVSRFRRRDDILARIDRELGEFDARLEAAAKSRQRDDDPPVSRTRVVTPEKPVNIPDGPRHGPETPRYVPETPRTPPPPVAKPEPISGWWWLVPIFFNGPGGVIAYFANRKANPGTARNMLITGIVFFILVFMVSCLGTLSDMYGY